MAYYREANYPKKLLVGFTEDQRRAMDRVSARDKRSLAGIVRDAVDRHLVAVGDDEGEGSVEKARGGMAYRLVCDGRK